MSLSQRLESSGAGENIDRVMAGVRRRHRPSWDGMDAGSPCLGLDWVPEDVYYV